MKYLKIELLKNQNGLVYPNGYEQGIGIYNELEGGLYFKENNKPYLLIAVANNLDYSSVGNQDRITEISLTDAKALSETHEIRREVVTDEAKIERLKIKASLIAGGKTSLGSDLTSDEIKALDPNDSTPGIEKNKIFADKFQEKENKIK